MSDLNKIASDIEERLVEEGYRKEKIKFRDPAGKTAKKARVLALTNAKENIREEVVKKLKHELRFLKNDIEDSKNDSLKETRLNEYVSWLKRVLQKDDWRLDRDQIEIKYARADGEGGQRTNKRSTAVIVTDKVSGVFCRNEETPEQEVNEKRAITNLEMKLRVHCGYWESLLETFSQQERDRSLERYCREILL